MARGVDRSALTRQRRVRIVGRALAERLGVGAFDDDVRPPSVRIAIRPTAPPMRRRFTWRDNDRSAQEPAEVRLAVAVYLLERDTSPAHEAARLRAVLAAAQAVQRQLEQLRGHVTADRRVRRRFGPPAPRSSTSRRSESQGHVERQDGSADSPLDQGDGGCGERERAVATTALTASATSRGWSSGTKCFPPGISVIRA